MLFGKPKMEEEERKRHHQEIEELICASRFTEAYQKTQELESLDKDAAGYHMSYFYIF